MHRILKFAASIGLALSFALAADVYQVETTRLADLMAWRPGDVIAEIGAGEGQMSFSAAAMVGATGHVYVTELDDKKLSHLKEEVQSHKLQNITVIKADPIRTNLPDACCEAIFMRRVYHHFINPAQTDAALFRDLKPGGRIAIIDFPPRSGLPPVEGAPKNHGGHGVAREVLEQELKAVGFEVISQSNGWPEQDYCVIARKPSQRVQ
ncbi:MAG TPA: methyltransferase domain-containing protein [Bryobacteraceae bacterium]|jgi:ubiquinone/menaquinone biosynthesis C-methylase UbiE